MLGRVEELLVVLLIVLVLFGGKQVPKLARGIGDSVRELKRGFSDAASSDSAVATGIEPTSARARIKPEPTTIRRSTGVRSTRTARPRRAA